MTTIPQLNDLPVARAESSQTVYGRPISQRATIQGLIGVTTYTCMAPFSENQHALCDRPLRGTPRGRLPS